MAIVKAILESPALILSSFTGRVTNTEYLSVYKQLYTSSNYTPGTNEISDLRYVESIEIDLACFQELLEWGMTDPASKIAKMKTAILIGKSINEGVVKLYTAISERYGNETLANFQRVEDALDWLDIDTLHTQTVESELTSLRTMDGIIHD